MTNIPDWIENFLTNLIEKFEDELVFVGIRGNIDEYSEPLDDIINIVVIFNSFSPKRLIQYDRFLNEQAERNVIVGFVAGKEELNYWDNSELFKLFYDTKAVYGNLDFISKQFNHETIQKAIQHSLTDLYQMNVNNFLYEKQNNQIERMYNRAVFIIKVIYLQKNKTYTDSIEELLAVIDELRHGEIIEIAMALHDGDNVNYELIAERLFAWTRQLLMEQE